MRKQKEQHWRGRGIQAEGYVVVMGESEREDKN